MFEVRLENFFNDLLPQLFAWLLDWENGWPPGGMDSTSSEWGVCPNREILMGPGCVTPSLGLWTLISPPGGWRALGVGV